ncbi:MAG: aspartate-semialdehyde dehydrogenase, partial [Clostridia bacterium]|nr:aspartate-semialdehyde dehydrogenase [Clostridia bacterium]
MRDYRVGIIGATGMVGQRFIRLLAEHPWFRVTCLAASSNSAGKTYREAVREWASAEAAIPESIAGMTVMDAADINSIAALVDFVFCAVNMKKDETLALEERYARAEIPVVSNNSANRLTPDVPMLIPEINGHHAGLIPAQKKRLGTKTGFIVVKPNCSIQSYVPALWPLLDFGPEKLIA